MLLKDATIQQIADEIADREIYYILLFSENGFNFQIASDLTKSDAKICLENALKRILIKLANEN